MGGQGLVEVLQAREGSVHAGEVVKGLDGSTGRATHITCRERGGKRRMCVCVCVAIRKWWCQNGGWWLSWRWEVEVEAGGDGALTSKYTCV